MAHSFGKSDPNSGSPLPRRITITPCHCRAGNFAAAAKGLGLGPTQPRFVGIGPQLQLQIELRRQRNSAAMRLMRSARLRLSTAWIVLNALSTGRTLLACRRPMNCQSISPRSASLAASTPLPARGFPQNCAALTHRGHESQQRSAPCSPPATSPLLATPPGALDTAAPGSPRLR